MSTAHMPGTALGSEETVVSKQTPDSETQLSEKD